MFTPLILCLIALTSLSIDVYSFQCLGKRVVPSISTSKSITFFPHKQLGLKMGNPTPRSGAIDLAREEEGKEEDVSVSSSLLADVSGVNYAAAPTPSDRTLILSIITRVAESYLPNKSFDDVDPTIFTENAHILCRGRLYEDVISNLIASAKSEQVSQHLQRIDALIRGFLSSERKSRSRLKVNYLLAAASEKLFDDAMEALSAR